MTQQPQPMSSASPTEPETSQTPLPISSPAFLQMWARAFQQVGAAHQDPLLMESGRLLQQAAQLSGPLASPTRN
jgi:hypothetical protein